MSGTERLISFIRKDTEDRLKPEGMSSELFWKIYELLEDKEKQWKE